MVAGGAAVAVPGAAAPAVPPAACGPWSGSGGGSAGKTPPVWFSRGSDPAGRPGERRHPYPLRRGHRRPDGRPPEAVGGPTAGAVKG